MATTKEIVFAIMNDMTTVKQFVDAIVNEFNKLDAENIAGCFINFKEERDQLRNELDKFRWIPVSERLPEESGDVLATDGDCFVVVWFAKNAGKWINAKISVTYWMPIILPEKGGE